MSVSRDIKPFSMICIAAIEVRSLVMEARKRMLLSWRGLALGPMQVLPKTFA